MNTGNGLVDMVIALSVYTTKTDNILVIGETNHWSKYSFQSKPNSDLLFV